MKEVLVLLLITIGAILLIIQLVKIIKTHGINTRDIFVIGLFTLVLLVLFCFGYAINSTSKLIDNRVIVNNERESNINYMDSTASDSLVYSMIKNLRIPHGKIVFAQAKLESYNYKSDLFKSNFNMFGMKYAVKRPTVTTNEYKGYQKYNSWKESIIDYLIWQYANNVDKLSDNEYKNYLKMYYAEDPQYIQKLNNIISKLK